MFNMRDLYPQVGLLTTHERTIPEAGEKQHYAGYPERTSDPATEAGTGSLFMAAAAAVILMLLLSFSG